jgi:hypothetical protein
MQEHIGPFDSHTEELFIEIVTGLRRSVRNPAELALAGPFGTDTWEVIDATPRLMVKAWASGDSRWFTLVQGER